MVHIEPDDDNLEKFTFRGASELAYLNQTPLPTETLEKEAQKDGSGDPGSWAGGIQTLRQRQGVAGSMARTSKRLRATKPLSSISEEQKPVTNTVKKTFKLHPDQKEMVEAALKDAKEQIRDQVRHRRPGIRLPGIHGNWTEWLPNHESRSHGLEEITGSEIALTVDTRGSHCQARPRLGHRHLEGVEVQMNRLLPTPTPQDIEATLNAIRNGESAICVWSQHCGIEKYDLWWVTSISPHGERHPGIGAGFTLDEAVADAWIGDFLPWGSFPAFSDEDYANVPRHVPDGWQFEVYAAPVFSPLFIRSFPIQLRSPFQIRS